jgi:hypothetical protein
MEHFLMDLDLDKKEFDAADEEAYKPPKEEAEDEFIFESKPELILNWDGRTRFLHLDKKTSWHY